MKRWRSLRPEQRTLTLLVGVVLFMGAMSWAAVPFYNWFCSVTGYGGTTQRAEAASTVVLDKTIRIRFDGNVDRDLDWTFRPMQTSMELKFGQTGLAFFEAVNNSDQVLTGTASFNVAPEVTGYYFDKLECFCFNEQTLAPGERVEMPVTFYVDPKMVEDGDANRVRDITLSYTFHLTETPKDSQAALDAGRRKTVN